MDRHSRWDEVKAKRPPPSEDVRASIERELAWAERFAGVGPEADRAGRPDAAEPDF